MSDLLDELIAAGTPSALVGKVARLIARADLLEERKANDRERKARQREMSREVTGQPGQDVTSASRASASPAEPKITNSSNPTEKQGKEETRSPASPVRAPSGKTALPADWEPSEAEVAYGMNLGHSRQRCLAIAEDLRLWAHGKGERRASWPATYQQFLRREAKGQGGGQSPTGPPRKKPSIYELNERANAFLRDLPDEPEHPLALPPYRQ
jgi:hypothetical protein